MSDLPFKVEYAKSSRAGCRGCKQKIQQGEFRIARMVDSPHFDGKQPMWFHSACFMGKKFTITNAAEVAGFENLKWEDQQQIQQKIEGGGSGVAAAAGPCPELLMEYAKSSRSKCRKCQDPIQAGEVRLGVMCDPDPDSSFQRPHPWWYHRRCFALALQFHENVPLATVTAADFQGTGISKEERKDINDLLDDARAAKGLAKVASGKGKGSKRKSTKQVVESEAPAVKKDKPLTKEEQALKKQSEIMWKIRTECQALGTGYLRDLLQHNGLKTNGNEVTLIDRVVQNMTFGLLAPCPLCSNHLVREGDGFACSGYVDGWQRCSFTSEDPPRLPWSMPESVKHVPFFKSFKFVKRKKVTAKNVPNPRVQNAPAAAAAAAAAASAAASSAASKLPLSGHSIAVVGKLSQSLPAIKALIKKLGGTPHTAAVGTRVTCLISSEADVEKESSKKIKDALKFCVPIVKLDFLEACDKAGNCVLMAPHVIKCTGSIVEPNQDEVVPERLQKRTRDEYELVPTVTAPNPKQIKVVIKGRCAVDPQSNLTSSHHVLDEGRTIWNASLSMTDLAHNTNSFYKLQVLEHDKGGACALFRSWGRTGTARGGSKCEGMGKASAKAMFETLFEEKTGQRWRGQVPYTKVPYKFFPLDLDYGFKQDEASKASGSSSSLPKEVQDFISLIFDTKMLERSMVEMDLDLEKLPLGNLTKPHLEEALHVLTELQGIIKRGSANASQLLTASGKFYTMIPHDFGSSAPPMIDNEELLTKKIRLVEDLLEIEIAARLVKGAKMSARNPIDAHYESLKCQLDPVSKSSDVFKMVNEYVQNTHAATHRAYSLEVEQLFTTERQGEASRAAKCSDIGNRRLLWHGSRLTNWCGILSEGLRIAPPSAPVTGYMFGKGVYFADMVSKSANYCFTSPSNSTGILILCEVALGDMLERKHADYINKLPKGKSSCWGQGQTAPDPKGYRTLEDGVVVPMGKGKPSGVAGTSLLYNEFIVYDVAQIKIKYLLRCRFKYKRR